jgi:hypothetical protein
MILSGLEHVANAFFNVSKLSSIPGLPDKSQPAILREYLSVINGKYANLSLSVYM